MKKKMTKVLIPTDDKYREMAENGAKFVEEELDGYDAVIVNLNQKDVEVYDLGKSLTIGQRTYKPKSPWKPYVIEWFMKNTRQDIRIIYTDADVIIRKNVDEVFENCDVAVTLRTRENPNVGPFAHISGFINAGVVFFNATEKAREFVQKWIEEMSNTTSGSDQEAINRVLFNAETYPKVGNTYELDGIRIKVLPDGIYNFTYTTEEIPKTAKIIHYIAKSTYGRGT